MNIQPTPTPQAPSYADRAFMHTEQAGVKVPLLQTAVMTGLVAFCILILTWLLDVMDGYKYALAALAIVPLAMWIFLQRRWLMLTAETIFQQDFSGDGVVGPVPTAARSIRVQIDHLEKNGHISVSDIIKIPATDAQLQALAAGFQIGRPFSEREWTGAGKPFSTNEFRNLRTVMLKRGLLALKNDKDPRQGYGLTEAGQALMDQYLTSPTDSMESA